MSQGEVEAAFTHMQARLKKANKPQKFLPKLPKWSALSSQQKRSLVGRSAFFMTISWLFMEYYVSRAPRTLFEIDINLTIDH